MAVRHATDRDLDAVALIGLRFLAASPYASLLHAEHSELVDRLRLLLQARGVVLIVEHEGEIRGALVGQLMSVWFASSCIGVELGWWVDQELRGTAAGVRLLWQFEDWCREQGASCVVLSDLVFAPAGPLFERLGYRLVERSHVKEII